MAEATAESTTQQIAWIREAAGDRFAQIEIGNFVIGGVKTKREQRLDPRIAAVFRSRTTGEQQSPQGIYTLIGSVDQICEQVPANRERSDKPLHFDYKKYAMRLLSLPSTLTYPYTSNIKAFNALTAQL